MPAPYESSATRLYTLASSSYSNSELINALVYRGDEAQAWGNNIPTTASPLTLTYSFPWANSSNAWFSGPEWYGNFLDYSSSNAHLAPSHFGFNLNQQEAARKALETWSSVANIRFVEISESAENVGDIRFAFSSAVDDSGLNAYAWTATPNDFWSMAGDVWVGARHSSDDPTVGHFFFEALVHELGHALGLAHPVDNGSDISRLYSLMSYTDFRNSGINELNEGFRVRFETPMIHDVLAIQYLYGANTSFNSNDNIYRFSPSDPFYRTVWDGGGLDTLDLSNWVASLRINLNEGATSDIIYPDLLSRNLTQSNPDSWYDGTNALSIAYGTVIENATGGSGDDFISGNAVANELWGMRGNDTIFGLAGNDQLYGGDGNDELHGNDGDDYIDGGMGNDYLYGGDGQDIIRLSAGDDYIDGGSGWDIFDASFIEPKEAKLEWGDEAWIFSVPGYLVSSTWWGRNTLVNIEAISLDGKEVRIDAKAHGSYADLPDALYQFFVVGFGAAPGVTYMDQMAEAYRYWLPQYKDGTVKQIVEAFTTKSQFTSVYPQALYRTEGGKYYAYAHDASLAGNPLVRGAEVSKAVFDAQMASLAQGLVATIVKTSANEATKTAAAADIQAALGLGGDWTIGEVIYTVFGNLASKPLSDPTWGGTAKQFANQVAVAKYYTDTLSQSTDDVATLRSVMAAVTNTTDVSSTDVIASLIGVALLNGPVG